VLAVEPFGRFEVADERRARLNGDDKPVFLPDPVTPTTAGKEPRGCGAGRSLVGSRSETQGEGDL